MANQITITIKGSFDKTTQELSDIINDALCDSNACGCEGTGGYSMSVEIDECNCNDNEEVNLSWIRWFLKKENQSGS